MQRAYAFATLQRVDAIVALTNTQREEALVVLGDRPVYVLPNAVDIDAFSFSSASTREDNLLVYLGWFIEEKGVFDLVDAVGWMTERGFRPRLQMNGAHGADRLRSYVKAAGLDHLISVGDWIDAKAKASLLARATAFVFASHNEGVPNVILEAMAAKVPIVSTGVGGLGEILRHGQNALVCRTRDPEDLGNKLIEILTTASLRDALAAAAFSDAIENFSVSSVKTIFDAVFGAVFGVRSRTSHETR